jgi:hypothetical protein
MGYASQLGRARINARAPQAAGVCDRCGFVYTHSTLQWQFDYAGSGLINKRILVCSSCLDTPQAQLRSIILDADPVPIQNPRIQDYALSSDNPRVTSAPPVIDPVTNIPIPQGSVRLTQNDYVRLTQMTGQARGSHSSQPDTDMNAIMPLFEQTKYGVVLPVLSVTTDGVTLLTVTCSSPHGLSTNNIVAVEGGGNNLMDGFYSVTVISATVFSYTPTVAVPVPGMSDPSLLQPSTIFKTAYVGLPRNMDQVPQSGVIS